MLSHDTNGPRPYSLNFRVQGTNGLWMDDVQSVYVEGKSKPHTWEKAGEPEDFPQCCLVERTGDFPCCQRRDLEFDLALHASLRLLRLMLQPGSDNRDTGRRITQYITFGQAGDDLKLVHSPLGVAALKLPELRYGSWPRLPSALPSGWGKDRFRPSSS